MIPMTTSQELYDQWKENGGNLNQYRDKYHRDVTDNHSHVEWHPSFVYRFRRTSHIGMSKNKSSIGENYKPPRETDSYSHLLFKHNGTDTWMHIKSSTSLIVGEPIGFRAYVTIRGQSLTVGEGHISTDPIEVFEWARNWMENNHDVSHLYD